MKKLTRISIAALMAAIMAVMLPLQSFAAGSELYISEVVIETGSSADEAKQKLTDAGYKVYDCNISNCENEDGTCGYMYIGYKTTSDRNDAITDMRLMHMGGGYSYAEYEQLIKQKATEIGDLMRKLTVAVREYRTNYAAGKQAAKVAYDMLNQLKEDDSGLLMGDYMLDKTKSSDDYTQMFMQCSTAVLITVQKALAIACSATNEQAIFNLRYLDGEDFEGETQYDVIATDIYNDLSSVQNTLSPYINSGLTTKDGATAEQIAAAFNDLSDEDRISWNDAFIFAHLLESIKTGEETTLYDLFTSDIDEITNEDLYPLASLLSDGQAAVLSFAGLQSVLTAAVLKDSDWSGIDEYSYKVDSPISIYAGIDRSLFDGGVALTSKAMVEAAVNTEKTWFGSIDAETEELFYDIIGISFFTMAGAGLLYTASQETVYIIFKTIFAKILASDWSLAATEIAAMRCVTVMNIITVAGIVFACVAMIALGVFLIAASIYLIAVGYNYYNPTYDEIPRILVEKELDAAEETVFTYYYGVKNLLGKVVDINQHDGPRWMSLYTTKDAEAGDPILDSFTIKDVNVLNGYVGLRKFSQTTAFSLNKFSYNNGFTITRDGKDVDIGDSYLFYKVSPVKDSFGSIFNGENAVIGIAGLALGAIAGVAGATVYINKKKRKVANA